MHGGWGGVAAWPSGHAPTLIDLLTLATSDLATALITAGATLLGVLVGAVLGAVTDFQLAKRRERAEGRAAARPHQEDLRQAAVVIAESLRIDHWFGPVAPTTTTWSDYRAVMASVLSEPTWRSQVSAVNALRATDSYASGWFRESNPPDPETGDPPMLDARLRSSLNAADTAVLTAYNALADLAGTTQEDQLAPPDPRDEWPSH